MTRTTHPARNLLVLATVSLVLACGEEAHSGGSDVFGGSGSGAAPGSGATGSGASGSGATSGAGATSSGATGAIGAGAAGRSSATGGAGGGAGNEDCNLVAASTPGELRSALLMASPGDCITLAPGEYAAPDKQSVPYAGANRSVYYYSQAAGTELEPIILRSADPSDKAVLRGLGSDDSTYLLWLNGPRWVVRNVVLRDGGKGIMLDEASDSVLAGVEVYNVGDEGIHLRSGTSDTLVEDCVVDGAGLNQPGFGEGIYIGSDNSQWDKYDQACDRNTVRNCTIRGTRAEALDIKEGTTGNRVEGCAIHGGAVSGENFADSFIDLKGDGAVVTGNTFFKEDNEIVTRGVAIVERPAGPTATDNWIFGNTFNMGNADGLMVHAYAGEDNHAWMNTRIPEGEDYQGNDPELYLTDPR